MMKFKLNIKAMGVNTAYKVSKSYKSGRHMYKNPKYKEYQDEIANEMRILFLNKKMFTGDVTLCIKCSYKSKRNRDVDGPIKGILDALSGIAYVDDVQIVMLKVAKEEGTMDMIEIGIQKWR